MSGVSKGHLFCLQWWKFQLYMLNFCHFCDIYLSDSARQAVLPIFPPNNKTSVSFSPLSLCFSRFLSVPIKQGSAIASIILVSNLFWEKNLIIAAAALTRAHMRGDASCCQHPLNLQLMNFSSIIQLGPNLINNRQLTDIVRRSSAPIMRSLSEGV